MVKKQIPRHKHAPSDIVETADDYLLPYLRSLRNPSKIERAVIEGSEPLPEGTAFPTEPHDDQLFRLTQKVGDNYPGLYRYDVWSDSWARLTIAFLGSGTANPTAGMITGDTFYRTDEDKWYAYDGTNWKCTHPKIGSGTSFPDNLDIGDLFYRTDLNTLFRLESLDPDVWEKVVYTTGEGTSFPEKATLGTLFYRTDEGHLYRCTEDVCTLDEHWSLLMRISLSGTYAERPASGDIIGEWYFSTDTMELYRWNGSSWDKVLQRVRHVTNLSDLAGLSNVEKGDTCYVITAGQTFYYDGANWKPLATIAHQGTTAQRTAFEPNASVGDIWYDTTESKFYRWNGSAWVFIATPNLVSMAGDLDDVSDGSLWKRLGVDWWIDGGKAFIQDLSQLIDGFFTADAAGRNKFEDLFVTNAKIANLDAGKIDTGFLSADRIEGGSLDIEKIKVESHFVEGLTLTNNSPSAGYIAWGTHKITYNGTQYSITAGNTNLKYVWWDKSYSTTALQGSDTLPTLEKEDILVAINDDGVANRIRTNTAIHGGVLETGTINADDAVIDGTLTTKKLVVETHFVEGLTLTDNTPSSGYISWSTHKITYNGTQYSITSGNTNKRYAWWDKSVSTTALQESNTKPTITAEDALITINESGIAYRVRTSTITHGGSIETGSIDTDELAADSITADKIKAGAIILAEAVGDLDDISDGDTYGKILLTDIQSGHILLAEVIGTLDDVIEGTIYGKVKLTSLQSGEVLLVEAVGSLDDIVDGTYGKVLVTSISSGKILVGQLDGTIDDMLDGDVFSKMPKDWRMAEDLTLIDGGKVYTGSLYAKSLHIESHIVEGLTLTNNSPSGGYIAWPSFKIVYAGVEYSISSGNTNLKYVWWDKSYSTTVLRSSNTKPTLIAEDTMIALNISGIAYVVSTRTLIHGGAIEAGSVDTGELKSGSVTTVILDADSVTAEKIQAGIINAGHVGAGQIETDHLSALSVVTDKLAANSVTAVKIQANSITADKVQAEAITTEKLIANAVTTEKIVGQAISIDKVATNIATNFLQTFFTKLKEWIIAYTTGDHLTAKTAWGENVYTREILSEEKIRYRVRAVLAELKNTEATPQTISFVDVRVFWGGVGPSVSAIISQWTSFKNFWDSLTQLGSGACNFVKDDTNRFVRPVPKDTTAADPMSIDAAGGSYNRWKLAADYSSDYYINDFSPYDQIMLSFNNQYTSEQEITLRLRICSDAGENNHKYADIVIPAKSHKLVVVKFDDMTDVGSPDLSSVQRISLELLTGITEAGNSLHFGFFALSTEGYIPLEIPYSDTYLEDERDCDILGDVNTTLELKYYFGGGASGTAASGHGMQYPSSDVRGAAYLEAVA